jgi:hypothetical protein
MDKSGAQSMSPSGETDDLQFHKAEFSGRKCVVCKSAIGDSYYQIQGRDACATCAKVRLEAQNLGDSGGKMMKALLWGGGAALLGSAAFAAVAFMGLRLAILSIGIGWLIGTAIKKGTEGHTSRKYQVIAVLLTYMAIATSYIPLVIVQLAKTQAKKQAQIVSRTSSENEATPKKPVSSGSAGLALVVMAGLVIALPFLDAFGRMPSGLITLLIVFFGLQQAWKQTAPDQAVVVGPYPNTQ